MSGRLPVQPQAHGRVGRRAAIGLVVCAMGVLPAPRGAGASSDAERLTCAALAARLPEMRRTPGRIALDAEARRVETDAAAHQITFCGGGTPTVLCLTEAAEDRQVGERLLVTGTVSEAGADYLRLEPCEHRAP